MFGSKQNPNGAYAEVILLWVKDLIEHKSPFINGDGTYSRDFTYIDNVIQAYELAITTSMENLINNLALYNESLPPNAPIDLVFNVAYGVDAPLLQLFDCLKINLFKYDNEIANIKTTFRDNTVGDVPHSMASIEKAMRILGYNPKFNAIIGFEEACEWYLTNLK